MAYRWTGSHAFRDHANGRVIDPGEELPGDVAEEIVSAHPHDVEEIDEEEGDVEEPEEQAEEGGDENPDVNEWANWNEDDWLDLGYEQRVEDVQEGRVDDHLETINEIERSSNVEDAVDERLSELEE